MNIIQRVITLEDKNEPLLIVPIGDVHLGNINCDIKKFKETVEYIKNKKNCYTILMGDLAEAILTTDRRFDPETVAPEFRDRIGDLAFAEFESLKEILLPIKDKILVAIRGGHEDVLKLKYNVDFHGWLMKELRVQDGGYASFLVIKLDRKQGFHCENVTFLLHHGVVASRKTGSKINFIESLASDFDFDVACLGHSHDLFVTSRVKLSVAGSKIKERKIYFVQTGSFLKTYVAGNICYGERNLYPPLKTGVAKLSLYPKNGNIDIHVSE